MTSAAAQDQPTVISSAMPRLLPAWLSKRGSSLLHAQCWAWGQDIRHHEGNLLLRYGFERLRPPNHLSGCSQYTCTREGVTIRLWGFGVYIGQTQGMYLNRFEFMPRHAKRADAWTPAQVGHGPRLRDPELLLTFLRWICDFESWVEETVGRRYRQAVLLSFAKHSEGALDLVVEWLRLKQAVQDFYSAETAAPPPTPPTIGRPELLPAPEGAAGTQRSSLSIPS